MRNSVKTQNQGLTSLICNNICNGNEMQLLIFFSERRDYRQKRGTCKLRVKLSRVFHVTTRELIQRAL